MDSDRIVRIYADGYTEGFANTENLGTFHRYDSSPEHEMLKQGLVPEAWRYSAQYQLYDARDISFAEARDTARDYDHESAGYEARGPPDYGKMATVARKMQKFEIIIRTMSPRTRALVLLALIIVVLAFVVLVALLYTEYATQ